MRRHSRYRPVTVGPAGVRRGRVSPGPSNPSWRIVRKRVALIALAAVTALAGVGGSVAYAGLHKTVTVSVDGKVWHVSTLHRTVGDVLTSQGITLDRHDAVAPSLTTAVNECTRIAVRYGRELTLTVDGTPQTYWVAATSVEAALE